MPERLPLAPLPLAQQYDALSFISNDHWHGSGASASYATRWLGMLLLRQASSCKLN